MTKLFVTLPALALVVALSGSAMADNGAISSATLEEMGLSGIEVMSDEQALAVRGLGWNGGNHLPEPDVHKKPWSLALGISFATADTEKHDVDLESGTLDGFLAVGKYMAMGEHLSEAGVVKTETHELWVKGSPAEKTVWSKSLKIGAGGRASASSL